MRTRALLSLLLLALVAQTVPAATVEVLKIPSTKMKRSISATLILPEGYKEGKQRYPVVYLLHGAGDTYKTWNEKTDIAKLADRYKMIVLCPDAGRTSWYFDSPIDPKYQYESFVTKDCVGYMDKHYRTKAERKFRAVCGQSMGGHGALFLAIRHRDLFSIAVAMSGGVDIRPFPGKWAIKNRIGDIKTHRENWEKLTVINLAKDLKDGALAISMDCGKNDFFLKVNHALHKQLLNDGITHRYVEFPGGHNWTYWQDAIKRQTAFIDEQFRK